MLTRKCRAYFDAYLVQDRCMNLETPGSYKTGLTAAVSITFGKFDIDLLCLYAVG